MPTNRDHRITAEHNEDEERTYWECDCGIGGSCPTVEWDLVSDRHIPEGEGRIDVHHG